MKEKKPKEKKEVPDYSGKNEAIQRLMAFVEAKGRASAIAKSIGMSDNIFSNMVKRDTKPSSELMIGLASLYPDLDIHYILTGKEIPILNSLKNEVRQKEEEIDYHRSVAMKLAKGRGAIQRPEERRDDIIKKDRVAIAKSTIKNVRKNDKKILPLPYSGRVHFTPVYTQL